uniref:CST complex subunit STN1 n=1 Tax=Salix viminalis TaxID=40686 RepID=A0A6N2MXF3_SALVM
MDQRLQNTHVKLLAFDLVSLTQTPSLSTYDPITFTRKNTTISRIEILGVVTSREIKPNKFLKFTIDDGTGCVTCVLWLNQLTSPYFSRRNPANVKLIADMAAHFASEIKIGVVARVRGRIAGYRENRSERQGRLKREGEAVLSLLPRRRRLIFQFIKQYKDAEEIKDSPLTLIKQGAEAGF